MDRPASPVRSVERLCWSVFMLCALICLYALVQARGASRAAAAPIPKNSVHAAASAVVASGEILGRAEIPRLHLSVPILEDDESKSLLRGLGHIRGTANLGGLGTIALAGHRDTFLRPIRNIALGMEVRLIGPSGSYRYIVDSTEVVDPEKVHVLDIQDEPKLVIITCFPFDYIGAAPRRFIVHAHLVSLVPDA